MNNSRMRVLNGFCHCDNAETLKMRFSSFFIEQNLNPKDYMSISSDFSSYDSCQDISLLEAVDDAFFLAYQPRLYDIIVALVDQFKWSCNPKELLRVCMHFFLKKSCTVFLYMG